MSAYKTQNNLVKPNKLIREYKKVVDYKMQKQKSTVNLTNLYQIQTKAHIFSRHIFEEGLNPSASNIYYQVMVKLEEWGIHRRDKQIGQSKFKAPVFRCMYV